MSVSEIKSKARAQLGNGIFQKKWLFALLLMVVYSAALGLCSMVGVGTLILGGALSYTVCFMFLKQARTNADYDLNDLKFSFADMNVFADLILLNLLETIFVALWSLLFWIPGIIKAIAYSMAYYIKIDHPEYNWKACLDESQKLMKGHKMEYFVLQLSFIGWYIVGVLTFGIGMLWVTPYVKAAESQFYLSITGNENTFDTEGV